MYGYVSVRTLLVRHERTETWKHALTRVEILEKGQNKPESANWEFETGNLIKATVSHEEFIELLDLVVEKGELSLPGRPAVDVDGRFSWQEYLCSKRRPFNLPWPTNYFQYRQNANAVLPGGSFVSLQSPAFGDISSLLQEQLGVEPGQPQGDTVGFFLPNYLARIEAIRLGRRHIAIHTSAKGIDLGSLRGKLHVTGNGGKRNLHLDFQFEQEVQIIPLDFAPIGLYLGLLSADTGAVVDFRGFHLTRGTLPAETGDVEWESTSEEQLDALILQGENERVEFKPSLANGEDIAETVIAFANGTGGIIVVGVDDRGNLLGFAGQQSENSVRNFLRHHCEPPINPRVYAAEVGGKSVLVIDVAEGLDKPYTLRGRGVIVRSGSTDRAATRDEIDAFYERKRGTPDIFGVFS